MTKRWEMMMTRKLTDKEKEDLVKRIQQEDYHSFGPYVRFEDGTTGLIPGYPTNRKFRVLSMFEFLSGVDIKISLEPTEQDLLRSELSELDIFLSNTPEENVIERLSLIGRKESVLRELDEVYGWSPSLE
jgi:hypothetical protein